MQFTTVNQQIIFKPISETVKTLIYDSTDEFIDSSVSVLVEQYDSVYQYCCTKHHVKNDFSTMSSCLEYAERYNGYDYNDTSPYVYSCTDKY